MASSACEFGRVLIANRGEVAIRIARACRLRGLESVAVVSDADRLAPHATAADRVASIGPASARESYLCIEALLGAAKAHGADAVHPGYGFLAENADFARAVRDAGLVWIGPPAAVIALMGDKLAARETARAAGVPLLPGAAVAEDDADGARRQAAALGYPVLVKAAAGGGGKGMRTVASASELAGALAAAAREASGAFGDGRVYLEKLAVRPRHVEVQILADGHGTVLHLGERECSIQRRHQKIVEESPCPVVTPALRDAMTAAAIGVARAVGYVSAGTVEFLLDADGHFYFLEMNTRLQVEHPVTELVTGLDLVVAQLDVARGLPLALRQEDVRPRGHAIEVRVYAEDPGRGFLPSAGPILALREPAGPHVRVDSGIAEGYVVPVDYDPMLSKISAWGPARADAIDRLREALAETVLLGPSTNVEFLHAVLSHPAFRRGETHTGFLDEHLPHWAPEEPEPALALAAAALARQAPRADGGAAGAGPAHEPTPGERLGAWRLGR
jgi:acetyl-CoA carboxylase biotin carboxylase subunit